MSYFELSELQALIPAEWLLGALDDTSSGTAEMFDEAQSAAENEINGWISLRYPLPLNPVPLFVKNAAMKIAAETCYARRGQITAFPWATELAVLRGDPKSSTPGVFQQIASGKVPLYPLTAPAPGPSSAPDSRPPRISAISGERSKVAGRHGQSGC